MAKYYRETGIITAHDEIAHGIFSLWIKTENIAEQVQPGQFVNLYSGDKTRLLPRPFAVCEVEDRSLRVVFRVVGEGTAEFAGLAQNDTVQIMGPLGNGFPMTEKKVLLVGGGTGLPALLSIAKALNYKTEFEVAAGFREETFLIDEFKNQTKTHIATEAGTVGVKGTVMDIIENMSFRPEVICACGPLPMLRALRSYAQSKEIAMWVSLEEKMACGIGVCLGCVCRSKETDAHSMVKNKRVCTEGPVFNINEVDF